MQRRGSRKEAQKPQKNKLKRKDCNRDAKSAEKTDLNFGLCVFFAPLRETA
jgi:hypothetical protein